MDFDSFFSTPRWNILEIIAKKPSSPVEISKELKTSVSYISQQLRLLEAANFVEKERTGMADKGKPRMIFSLNKEMVYFTSLTRNPVKKLVYLTDYHKSVLNIWAIEDTKIHNSLNKAYYFLESYLDEIDSIYFDISKFKLIVVTDSKKLKPILDAYFKKSDFLFGILITSLKDFDSFDKTKLNFIFSSNSEKNIERRSA